MNETKTPETHTSEWAEASEAKRRAESAANTVTKLADAEREAGREMGSDIWSDIRDAFAMQREAHEAFALGEWKEAEELFKASSDTMHHLGSDIAEGWTSNADYNG